MLRGAVPHATAQHHPDEEVIVDDRPDPFLRLSPLEVALSAPVGTSSRVPTRQREHGARTALERAVLPALRSGSCHVLFSGGRDSSLVLAVATAVARREGLPLPVPVTAVYPGVPESDESEWQERVLAHLGLTRRVVIEVRDERSLLGDVSVASLARRGLVWPAAVQSQPRLFDGLDPGAHVLTGEGGDGFVAPVRGTPLHLLASSRRRPSRALVRAGAEALEPAALARRRVRRGTGLRDSAPWLTRRALDVLARETVDARGPLRWDVAKRALLGRRSTVLALHNTAAGAAELGVTLHHPLADETFVAALAADGGPRGFRGRTDTFRRLGADLLPDAVLARSTKARFNSSRWGDRERDFAVSWDGSGVDPELVDVARLRREWLGSPLPASRFLVHVAWLAASPRTARAVA
ncbi:asparagine synthase-related protein [Cellulosimicrobium sp. Marseille-Q8652]